MYVTLENSCGNAQSLAKAAGHFFVRTCSNHETHHSTVYSRVSGCAGGDRVRNQIDLQLPLLVFESGMRVLGHAFTRHLQNSQAKTPSL
jgi:hypothetical protein